MFTPFPLASSIHSIHSSRRSCSFPLDTGLMECSRRDSGLTTQQFPFVPSLWFFSNDMFQEQSANVAYFMTNSEPLMDFAGPTTSRVIPIGGITAMEPKPLDEVFSHEVARQRSLIALGRGAISSGSNCSHLIWNCCRESNYADCNEEKHCQSKALH